MANVLNMNWVFVLAVTTFDAALRVVRVPASQSALATRTAPIWAVALAGQVRTFAYDKVSQARTRYLISPLEVIGGVDVYFAVDAHAKAALVTSESRWVAAMEGMRVLGGVNLRSEEGLAHRSRTSKLKECADMWGRVEEQVTAIREPHRRLIRCNASCTSDIHHNCTQRSCYTYILTARPDLEFLQPVDAVALAHMGTKTPHTYDMLAQCPRTFQGVCTFGWHSISLPPSKTLWHFNLARTDHISGAKSWWLSVVAYELDSLHRLTARCVRGTVSLARCAFRAAARMCQRYDAYLGYVLREHAPIFREWDSALVRARPDAIIVSQTTSLPAWYIHQATIFSAKLSCRQLRGQVVALRATVTRFLNGLSSNEDTTKGHRTTNTRRVLLPDKMLSVQLDAQCWPMRVMCADMVFFNVNVSTGQAPRMIAPLEDAQLKRYAHDLCLLSWSNREGPSFLLHDPITTNLHNHVDATTCLNNQAEHGSWERASRQYPTWGRRIPLGWSAPSRTLT